MTIELCNVTLRSDDGAYEREAWFWPGPAGATRLGVCLDGEFYLERLGALPLIEALHERGAIEPMSWLFVASGGPAARHADLTINPAFARFIAIDAIDWARAQVPSLAAGHHLACGLSLSGLAAAHLALAHGDRFAAALCQSGSFWWKPDALETAARDCTTHPRVWLSVGDQETDTDVRHPPTGLHQVLSQIEGVDRARSILERAGCTVHHHHYAGGHEFPPWRAELQDAITWLVAGA